MKKMLIVILGFIAFFQSTSYCQAQNKSVSIPITVGEKLKITSKLLNEDRQILVYLPASYATSKQRYPVIYTLDGEGTAPVIANVVDFMTGYSEFPQMPEAIVVGITNTDRNRDMPIPQVYDKNKGQENFLAFLADELIPTIEQKYHTQPLRVLVGHSQGGLFAYYAMTAQKTPFQWYLPVDAPLSGFAQVKPIMDKARELVKTPNYRGRLVAVENLYGWHKEWSSLVDNSAKTFYAARVEIKDETHETMFYKGAYEGLKRLFNDYAPDTKDAKLPVLDTKYKMLSEAYGYQVDIPQQILLRSANRNVMAREGAEAVKLIKRAIELYGETQDMKARLMIAEDAAKKGGPDPRIAEWAKLPPPSVEQIKPFLGTWEWTLEEGARFFITFEVKDGVVRAQHKGIPPSGDSFELPIHFVKVVDAQTVQWGERNGRGPGVTVFTAKLVDNKTLKGKAEGVDFYIQRPPENFTYRLSSR